MRVKHVVITSESITLESKSELAALVQISNYNVRKEFGRSDDTSRRKAASKIINLDFDILV